MGLIFDAGTLTGSSDPLGTIASPNSLTAVDSAITGFIEIPLSVDLSESLANDWSEMSLSWTIEFLIPDSTGKTPGQTGYSTTLSGTYGLGGDISQCYGVAFDDFDASPSLWHIDGFLVFAYDYRQAAHAAMVAFVNANPNFARDKIWTSVTFEAAYTYFNGSMSVPRNPHLYHTLIKIDYTNNPDYYILTP